MSREDDLRLLELKENATYNDVNHAYQKLLQRYGAGRIASYGLFRANERHRFLQALQEAFRRLVSDGMGSMSMSSYKTPLEMPLVTRGISPHLTEVQPTVETAPAMEAAPELPLLKTPDSFVQEEKVQLEQPSPYPETIGYWDENAPLLEEYPPTKVDEDYFNTTDIPLDVEAISEQEEIRSLIQKKQKTRPPEKRLQFTAWKLREVRLEQGLSLQDAAELAQIPERVLFQIEAPAFAAFANDLHRLRKILLSYAKVLKLDHDVVIKDYFEAYWIWYAEQGKHGSSR